MPYSEDIFYRLYDDNPKPFAYPILLLHGSGGNHISWPGEVRRQENQRVLALDLPGHGRTTSTVCHSIQTLVFSLRKFILNMKILRVILAGHSLGAALALHYAAAYPEDVKGLFLLACGAQFLLPYSIFDHLRSPGQMSRVMEGFNLIAFDRQFPQNKRREVLAPMLKLRRSALLADLAICANFSCVTNFDRITCPTRLVAGESDMIAKPAAVRQLAYCLPTATYITLPQCGHLLMHEKTDMVSQLLQGFLRDLEVK